MFKLIALIFIFLGPSALQAGNQYTYQNDSLGRLTNITFPGGDTQTMSYDNTTGFIASITRTNMGSITYTYDNATNLLSEKRRFGKTGLLENLTAHQYDNISRLTTRTHTNYDASGTLLDTAVYDFLYDGNYYNLAADSTQLGHLTAIRGPKFIKEMSYTQDELIKEFHLTIDAKKRLTKTTNYFSQRAIESESYTLTDLTTNTTLLSRTIEREYDPIHGKLNLVTLNSIPLYNYHFNDLQEITGATYNGNFLSFNRDASTRKLHEISENGMGRGWTFNNRNLIDTMDLDFGGRTVSKTFGYSDNKYLNALTQIDSGAPDLNMDFSYAIDGIINSVTKDGTITAHERFTDHWQLGSEQYPLDHVGRVTSKHTKSYTYGATGRISMAASGATNLATYFYDEENNPIVKIYANNDLEFYFENSVIKNADYFTPITIEGMNHTIGYFKNTTFHKVDTDHLGTLLRDKDNLVNLATPYGERSTRTPEDHQTMDFTLKGFDSEIGAVRMGRRYYDSEAKRFLTPDGYFLENYDKILESPVEGNLYSYASNNPINAIDITGQNTLFLGGAGYEEETKGYSNQIVSKMKSAGIASPKYVSISTRGGQAGNIGFALIGRNRQLPKYGAWSSTLNKVSSASNTKGGQRNVVGYSYGSVVAAQSALRMANSGKKLDNLILIGSPISSSSSLYKALINNKNIGNVHRIDIKNDPISNGIDLTNIGNIDNHFKYMDNKQGQQDSLVNEIKNVTKGK
jgi:RHS repeat-associated protein